MPNPPSIGVGVAGLVLIIAGVVNIAGASFNYDWSYRRSWGAADRWLGRPVARQLMGFIGGLMVALGIWFLLIGSSLL